jgi:ribose 5-phosphate isomerase A
MSKELLAKAIASRAQNNQIIGLGSGTTTEMALIEIGTRIKAENLTIFGIPTSLRTATLASSLGIKVLDSFSSTFCDWAFDGADEVDTEHHLIKGRGGAMFLEKIVAKKAKHYVIVVTEDKLVSNLGTKFAIPVETASEAVSIVEAELLRFGAKSVVLRQAEKKYGPVVTEKGNLILDAKFENIPKELEVKIKTIVGVIESGLFFGFSPELFVARESGVFSVCVENGRKKETKIL